MDKLQRARLRAEINPPSGPSNSVIPFDFTKLILKVKHSNSRGGVLRAIYVYRALYDGVPSIQDVEQSVRHVYRLLLVQKIYEWLLEVGKRNGDTAESYFSNLIHFFRFCDTNKIKAELTSPVIDSYAEYIRAGVRIRPESVEKLRHMATTFSAFLVWNGSDDLAILLPKVVRKNALVSKTSAYSDAEQVGVSRDLFRVFNVLASRLKTGAPTTCPFEQSALLWDVGPTNNTAWYNKLTTTAFFLTANFIGDNRTALWNLRRSDVVGREFHFDNTVNLYRLTTTKARQGAQENVWDLGFTQRGRDFFNAYLSCLDLFDLPENAALFPRFINGKYRGAICNSDLVSYANWFVKSSPSQVRPIIARFRQSKSDGLMADTNSIAIVAEGLNNLQTTVARHYMNGNPHNNRSRLGSAAEALVLTARGATVEEARKVVEAKYGKPLRVMEIITMGQSVPTPTKLGTRCREPFGEKAQRLQRELVQGGLLGKDESIACFKFMECFDCDYQALVAEVDDIWCMLSFNESLLEALQRPAINHHLPLDRVTDIITKTQAMLADIKRNYPEVFADAVLKFKNEAHPIWGDESSIADFYEIW